VVKKIECPEPTPGAAVTARLESDVQYVMEEAVPANLVTWLSEATPKLAPMSVILSPPLALALPG
jgi:hypothetical protein